MPQGKVHFVIEASVALAAGAAYAFIPAVREAMPTDGLLRVFWPGLIAGYLFGLFFISPDLDLPNSFVRSRWGPLGFIWDPYMILFKHRGMSHSFLFGTLTRLAWLAFLLALPVLVAGIVVVKMEWLRAADALRYLPEGTMALGGFVAGCYLNDLVHIATDHSWTLTKRHARRRKRRLPLWMRLFLR
ncbi:MAG: DUF2227 family putative metal-binding protein [Sumerlaeia bacterium]